MTAITFILINIYSSQQVNPLYFSFITEDQTAVVQTLRKARPLLEFNDLLAMQQSIYGDGLNRSVNKETDERSFSIKVLENLLKKNPQARDVLYDLAVLNKENLNYVKANSYLKKAQQVDPSIPNFNN